MTFIMSQSQRLTDKKNNANLAAYYKKSHKKQAGG
jgi:hypothetical protein